jgi:hypothetical protein
LNRKVGLIGVVLDGGFDVGGHYQRL